MRQNMGLDGGDGGYSDGPQNDTSRRFSKWAGGKNGWETTYDASWWVKLLMCPLSEFIVGIANPVTLGIKKC